VVNVNVRQGYSVEIQDVYKLSALKLKSVFKNFVLKFTNKCNIEIGDLICREVSSGGFSLRSSNLTQEYSTNGRRRK